MSSNRAKEMEDRSLKIRERTMAEKMTFEDLDAWKQARSLVNGIYALTREAGLGRDFGLSSQLQPAAVSVMTNIAEGFERAHLLEKLQFCNVARSSAGEVRSLLYVVGDNFPGTAAQNRNFASQRSRYRKACDRIDRLNRKAAQPFRQTTFSVFSAFLALALAASAIFYLPSPVFYSRCPIPSSQSKT